MANFNFNKVIIGGRITHDIELKQTPTGVPVATFGIAVNRKAVKDKPQEADFFNCTAWRGTAEIIKKYFRKGSSICIVGSLQNRTWNDNEGNKRYATDIVVDEAIFVDSKTTSQGTEVSASTNYIPDTYKTPQNANFEAVGEDTDGLPF